MIDVSFTVDGRMHTVNVDEDMPLLYALRNELDLKNPRFGCGLAQCGACTVILNGRAVRSCVTPVVSTEGAEVTTLAGLGNPGNPHPVQQAFIETWASQCGYCLNGWIMTTVDLLDRNSNPTDAEIRQAFSGLKCRCAMHIRFLQAAKRAAELKRETARSREAAE